MFLCDQLLDAPAYVSWACKFDTRVQHELGAANGEHVLVGCECLKMSITDAYVTNVSTAHSNTTHKMLNV